MKLTAIPFDTETGELLPIYRDAYRRGDLARASAQAVDDYLHRQTDVAAALVHWHRPLTAAEAAPAPNQAAGPTQIAREQPPRFRRLALSLSLLGLTLAGASTAASHLPSSKVPTTELPTASTAALLAATKASGTVVLHGRILNQWGQPLAGATVRQKGTAHRTRTDASGSYHLRVPAGTPATLCCSYDGHAGQEVSAAYSVSAAPQMPGR